mgnify:CR=1 FL=1
MKVGDLVKFVPYKGNDGFENKKDRGVGIITEVELINDFTMGAGIGFVSLI